jgi:hypothetical protein
MTWQPRFDDMVYQHRLRQLLKTSWFLSIKQGFHPYMLIKMMVFRPEIPKYPAYIRKIVSGM